MVNPIQPIQLSKLLRKLSKEYNSAAVKFVKRDFNLTKPQLSVLYQLQDEPRTIGQICEEVELSYSTVSGIIDRLERDGWVKRIRDKDDRRLIWIHITEKQAQFYDAIQTYHDKFYGTILDSLSEQQINTIIEALTVLIQQFQLHSETTEHKKTNN